MKQLEAATKEEIEDTKAKLRKLPYGTKMQTILRSCSRSGMMRIIDIIFINTDEEGKPYQDSVWIRDPKNFFGVVNDSVRGYKVSGCGMDMGFHLVYSLGHYIWKGHEKELQEKTKNIDDYQCKNGGLTDGGYYFRQEWL